jgi:hypothetical protein
MNIEINGFKVGDTAYILCNPFDIEVGFQELVIVNGYNLEGRRTLYAVNPKDPFKERYDVARWSSGKNPPLKKSKELLDKIITLKDILDD